jgi:hypothetical protein
MEIKNITAQGNNGKKNHTVRSCAATISLKFKDPANNITGRMRMPKETS